ncbi:MAG: hypothetical protein WC758_03040 [Candidatus Woesearchaeota archaeon]|jgi:hypothetical protein
MQKDQQDIQPTNSNVIETIPTSNVIETITNPILVELRIEPGYTSKSYIIILDVTDINKTAKYTTYTIGVDSILTSTTSKPNYETRNFSYFGSMNDNQIPSRIDKNCLRVGNVKDIGELITLLNSNDKFSAVRNTLKDINILKPVNDAYHKKSN